MPSLRADPTTDHARDATATRGGSAPGAGFASDATADHEEDSPHSGHGPALRHERFRIGDKLGEGGMGVVYRAVDTRDGRDVALKLMKGSLAGTARRRFEREFRSISALHHPHCLNVYDYGELDGGPFFTMELFQGRPITSLAGRAVEDVLDPLLQVTLALDYIHHQGIIHRDVKPSNILVRPSIRHDGRPGFEAKLMDFGLAKYYGVKSSLSAEGGFVGTVAYCAPEQINNDELDHRADLYCLGLVSYELLSGRYPFPEARLAGMRPLMRAQLNDKPRPLAEVNPEVPGPIAEAVMRYLRKEARRRPDSAALLRDAIAAYLGIDDQTAVYGAAMAPARPVLSVTGFVCRSIELEAMDDMFRRCLSPSGIAASSTGEAPPSLIVVMGEPGIGKSSVVQEAERIARGHGCQVYEGRCFDGNLAPFQPFVEIIRQLIAELRLQERREAAPPELDLTVTHGAGLPVESAARLLAVVKDYSGELLRIAPELRKHLPGEAYHQADFGREADYIFRALSAFFIELATLQPICLSFEDLQWADKSTLDLLRHLAAALDAARRTGTDGPAAAPRLTIVASARTGYPQLDDLLAPLRERRQLMELHLAPLAVSEARELIALRLNCRPEDLADDLVARVHELCGGNPFFVSETVREWFEKEAIARGGSGWMLATEAADSTDLPETVRDAMRLRLQGLSAKVQEVIGAAAVIGAVIEIDLLREVLPDHTEGDVLDAIDVLLPRRVFRETANAGRVQFVHDLLRELPYGDLSATRRRSLHRRVGERLEDRRGRGQAVAPAVLADHFRNAADRPKAFVYSMQAAEAAIDAYAFNDAIAQLNEARTLLPSDANAATAYRLAMMLGQASGCLGRFDEAIGAYTQALAHSEDGITRGKAHLGIGENFLRKGRFDDALRHLDLSMREVGYPRPRRLAGLVLDTVTCALYVHCLPGWVRFPGRGQGPDRQRAIETAFTCNYLCFQILGMVDVIMYANCAYKVARFAKQTGRPEQVAVASSSLATNLGFLGAFRMGRRHIADALRAVESRPHDTLWARTMGMLGAANYAAGRLDEAEVFFRQAVEPLDRVAEYFTSFSHHFLRHLYAVRGDIPSELAEAEAEIALGTIRGDDEALAWGMFGKASALARAGRTDEARELAERALEILRRKKSLAIAVALVVMGFVQMQASDYASARSALEESARVIRVKLWFMEVAAPTFPLLVESLLGPCWSDPENGPGQVVARKARRESRFARFIGWLFPNCRPHGLRVSGRAAFALGKTKQAALYLERSIAAAEELGARYDLARAWLDASFVIPEKADEYRRRGQQLLDELGAVVPEAERLHLTASGHP
jgi:eukaryotic-like serine/threonine-protein kinase